jgi:Fic family protein
MPEETFSPLSAAELAEIDARYVPFPSFSAWPKELGDAARWDTSREEFRATAEEATEADLRRALEIAQRAAAFDTGAIEGLYSTNRGLTFTVAEQTALWEQMVEEQGPNARALFEAQLRAFELVLDQVTHSYPKITQAWIRRLHDELTGPQATYVVLTPLGAQEQPLPKGSYKEHPNHVRTSAGEIHAYAPVEQTQAEMQRLVDELQSTGFREATPIIQAAYAHYGLVAIHPFADGNGRVARAIASAYTYRDASIPLLVLNEHRDEYFAALAKADAGDPTPFVGFIEQVALDTLVLVRDSLRTARAPAPNAVLHEFQGLLQTKQTELDQLGSEFAEWLHATATRSVAGLDVPNGIEIAVEALTDNVQAPAGFRDILASGLKGIRFHLRASPPAEVTILRRIDLYLAADADDALLLRSIDAPEEKLFLGLTEIRPQLSSIAQVRVENFLERILGQGLEELWGKVNGKLRGTDSQ